MSPDEFRRRRERGTRHLLLVSVQRQPRGYHQLEGPIAKRLAVELPFHRSVVVHLVAVVGHDGPGHLDVDVESMTAELVGNRIVFLGSLRGRLELNDPLRIIPGILLERPRDRLMGFIHKTLRFPLELLIEFIL